MSADVDAAVAAIEAGQVVVFPADTVYGLAATAATEAGRDALYALKGRETRQPTALMATSVGVLLELLPELEGRPERAVRALLPGPYTLVLANPGRRFPWLCGDRPDAIGVRVPSLAGPGRELLSRVGAVAATSANLPGGSEPRALADVPERLRGGAGAVLDGGRVPGTPSTVLDLTAAEPHVLRAGAGPVAEALASLARLV